MDQIPRQFTCGRVNTDDDASRCQNRVHVPEEIGAMYALCSACAHVHDLRPHRFAWTKASVIVDLAESFRMSMEACLHNGGKIDTFEYYDPWGDVFHDIIWANNIDELIDKATKHPEIDSERVKAMLKGLA